MLPRLFVSDEGPGRSGMALWAELRISASSAGDTSFLFCLYVAEVGHLPAAHPSAGASRSVKELINHSKVAFARGSDIFDG